MDLNIVKIINQVNSSEFVRYVSTKSTQTHIEVCMLSTEAKLFTRQDAEKITQQIKLCLPITDNIVTIVPLAVADKHDGITPPKGDLNRWYDIDALDRSRLIRFLEGNTENLTMQSSRIIHGSDQFYVGTYDGIFQVIVSLPGHWLYNQLDDSIDYNGYGFSGYTANQYGTGKGLFTVFTFTE